MNKEKQYGLIMPKKPQLSAPRAGNIFGDDNDSDTEDGVDWVKKALKAEGEKNRVKKQTKLKMEKALNEDPTIYQYDEIYEDLDKSKGQSKSNEKKEVVKPKYIHNLMKNAERRKREQEHRIERMVQKEREAEGELFADKESFVTSAYRAKLEEFKKMEEEEERMDRLEAIGDVTKQQDMSGFYRQLYSQTVDKVKNEPTDEESTQKADNPNIDQDEHMSSESQSSSERDTDSEHEAEDNKHEEATKITSKTRRQYRRRKMEESESESEPEPEEKQEDNAEETIDNDEEPQEYNEELESPTKKPRLSIEEKEEEVDVNDKDEDNAKVFKVSETKSSATEEDSKKTVDIEEPKPEKIKVSIWEKRTVGPAFDAALQRYYSRKAVRLSGV